MLTIFKTINNIDIKTTKELNIKIIKVLVIKNIKDLKEFYLNNECAKTSSNLAK